MQKIRVALERLRKRWGFFEYTLAVIALVVCAGIVYLLAQKPEYITVVIRIANREMQYLDDGAPSAIDTRRFIPGLEGKDVFGRLNAQITGIDSFPKPQTSEYGVKRTVYVTVKLAASYNARAGTYKYKGENIVFGEWIRIEVGPVVVAGIVSDINGRLYTPEMSLMRVKAQLKTEDPRERSVFENTTGVDAYIADAIHVGDVMYDGSGNAMATVLDKIVSPARTTTSDAYGNLYDRPNPRKKDVSLLLELRVRKQGVAAVFPIHYHRATGDGNCFFWSVAFLSLRHMYVVFQFPLEALVTELSRVSMELAWVKSHVAKSSDCMLERAWRMGVKQDSCFSFDDRFFSSTCVISNNGNAVCHRLKRRYPEIFVS